MVSSNLPLIYCAMRPDNRPRERTPAVQAIANVARHYGIRFYRCLVEDELDYARGLAMLWNEPGDLINIEHDMAPTVEMIEGLLACSEETCSQIYWLAPASTGRIEPGLAARIGYETSEWRSIKTGETFASQSGIGLVKLAESWRQQHDPIEIVRWDYVEHAIHYRLGRTGWHIHWPPCPHYHGFVDAAQGDDDSGRQAIDWPGREAIGQVRRTDSRTLYRPDTVPSY